MDLIKQAELLLEQERYVEFDTVITELSKSQKQIADELNLRKAAALGDESHLEKLVDEYLSTYENAPISNVVVAARVKLNLLKYDEAIALAEKVIEREPSNFEAAELIYISNINTKQYRNALAVAKTLRSEAERLKKSEVQQLAYVHNEFIARTMIAQYREAIELWEATDSSRVNHPETVTSVIQSCLIRCFVAIGRYAHAVQMINDQKLEEIPDPHLALAIPLVWQGIGDEARCFSSHHRIIEMMPDSVEPKWNYALAQISFGYLKEGFTDYEIRWQWDDFPSSKRTFKSPKWKGEDLAGKDILIWGEQGVGDQLLFLTLLPFVLNKNPKTLFIEVSEKLVPLVKHWFPEAIVRDDRVKNTDGQLIYDQLHFNLPSGSLMGLMLAEQGDLRTTRRYLKPPANAREALFPENFRDKKWIVGVSWRSHYLNESRTFNYLNVHAIIRLLEVLPKDIGFVSLQYSITDDERALLADFENMFVPDEDFFERVDLNALYAGCCDLVVSAGTVVLQLAGIYGIPMVTWLPKNDWVLLGEKHYPWFENVVVVQGEANWDTTAMLYALIGKIKILLRIDD